jgi:hypothetical protein
MSLKAFVEAIIRAHVALETSGAAARAATHSHVGLITTVDADPNPVRAVSPLCRPSITPIRLVRRATPDGSEHRDNCKDNRGGDVLHHASLFCRLPPEACARQAPPRPASIPLPFPPPGTLSSSPMSSESTYALADIVSRLGDATEAEARLELEGLGNDDFIAKGRRIGTPRLAKELARNYGILADWLSSAKSEQLDLLAFVGADWLRIAAWAARQSEIHYDANQKGASLGSAEKQIRQARAEELATEARRARDRVRTALLHLAAGTAAWVPRIEAAYATPGTQSPITDALLALCDVADAMLADTAPGLKKRRTRNRLDTNTVARYRDLAATAATAIREAAAVAPAAPVSQSQVDLWDGIAITFFEQLVDVVEQAREEDPTIPAPSIIGLRGWFRRSSRKNRDAAEAPAVPDGG